MLDSALLKKFVGTIWDDAVVPLARRLHQDPEQIAAYDVDWAKHGYMDEAVKLMERWARQHLASLKGATLESCGCQSARR